MPVSKKLQANTRWWIWWTAQHQHVSTVSRVNIINVKKDGFISFFLPLNKNEAKISGYRCCHPALVICRVCAQWWSIAIKVPLNTYITGIRTTLHVKDKTQKLIQCWIFSLGDVVSAFMLYKLYYSQTAGGDQDILASFLKYFDSVVIMLMLAFSSKCGCVY